MVKRPTPRGELPEKLRSIFNMLRSEFKGERENAANQFWAACKREGIDPMDLHLSLGGRGSAGSLAARNKAVIDQLLSDNRRLSLEVKNLNDKLAAGTKDDARIKKLQAAHKAKISELEADLVAALTELEELRPERDPWQDKVERYLADNPADRHTSYDILNNLIGASAVQDVVASRRLGGIMRAIGDGWIPSNNVAEQDVAAGRRLRGYVRSPHRR
jgi:hypothetical protein